MDTEFLQLLGVILQYLFIITTFWCPKILKLLKKGITRKREENQLPLQIFLLLLVFTFLYSKFCFQRPGSGDDSFHTHNLSNDFLQEFNKNKKYVMLALPWTVHTSIKFSTMANIEVLLPASCPLDLEIVELYWNGILSV